MATLTEITDQDSGVASSEATPESQNLSPSTQEETVTVATEASSAEDKTDSPCQAPDSTGTSLARNELDDDEEEEEQDLDESVLERIWGLTEMFPDRLRTSSVNAANSTISLAKGAYDVTRQAVWIAVSTSVLLFAPVMFELERLNVEEMMKQDRNRLVLGPGSAMSGPPSTPGLMPPPPTR